MLLRVFHHITIKVVCTTFRYFVITSE